MGRLLRARHTPWSIGLGMMIVLFVLAAAATDHINPGNVHEGLGLLLIWTVVVGVPVVFVASVLARRGIILTIVRYVVVLGFGFLSAVVGGLLAFGVFKCGTSLGMLGSLSSNECPPQGEAIWNATTILGVTLLIWAALSILEYYVIRFTQHWLLPKLPTRFQSILRQ